MSDLEGALAAAQADLAAALRCIPFNVEARTCIARAMDRLSAAQAPATEAGSSPTMAPVRAALVQAVSHQQKGDVSASISSLILAVDRLTEVVGP